MNTDKATLDSIAATLISGGDAPVVEEEQTAPTVGEEEEEQLELALEDGDDTSEVEEEVDVEDDDPDLEEEEEEEVAGPEYLDIEDDVQVEVMVDGELQTLSLGDLKKAASGEGAIEKRLTEATETRKTANAERAQWTQEREVQHQMLTSAFDAMHSMLFQPRVSAPDPALKATNPQQYLLQQDDFEKEQHRIATLQGQVQELYGQLKGSINEDTANYRKQQAIYLADALPVLKDKEKGPAVQKEIIAAANHYGFTQEEIQLAADHRLFKMAYDAAQWRKAQQEGKKAETVVEETKKKVRKKAPKTIRSGVIARKKSTAQAQRSKQDKVRRQAKKTGKIDDIAAMIME